MTPLALFRSGLDTVQIADRLGITEAEASRRVHVERSEELGLPVNYERQLSRRYQIDRYGHRLPERASA